MPRSKKAKESSSFSPFQQKKVKTYQGHRGGTTTATLSGGGGGGCGVSSSSSSSGDSATNNINGIKHGKKISPRSLRQLHSRYHRHDNNNMMRLSQTISSSPSVSTPPLSLYPILHNNTQHITTTSSPPPSYHPSLHHRDDIISSYKIFNIAQSPLQQRHNILSSQYRQYSPSLSSPYTTPYRSFSYTYDPEAIAKFEAERQKQLAIERENEMYEEKMRQATAKVAEEIRQEELEYETKSRILNTKINDVLTKILEPLYETTDRLNDPWQHQGFGKDDYSNLRPFLFSSYENESWSVIYGRQFLKSIGLYGAVVMVKEAGDDIVEYLNKIEPWGQRKRDRKYRLLNRMNKPYARYGPGDYQRKIEERKLSRERRAQAQIQEVEKQKKTLLLKRKAREAMGLDPDPEIEKQFRELFPDEAAAETPGPEREISEFEKFREAFKAKADVYADDASASNDSTTTKKKKGKSSSKKKDAEKAAAANDGDQADDEGGDDDDPDDKDSATETGKDTDDSEQSSQTEYDEQGNRILKPGKRPKKKKCVAEYDEFVMEQERQLREHRKTIIDKYKNLTEEERFNIIFSPDFLRDDDFEKKLLAERFIKRGELDDAIAAEQTEYETATDPEWDPRKPAPPYYHDSPSMKKWKVYELENEGLIRYQAGRLQRRFMNGQGPRVEVRIHSGSYGQPREIASHLGFGGYGNVEDSLVYEYIYGRKIPDQVHGLRHFFDTFPEDEKPSVIEAKERRERREKAGLDPDGPSSDEEDKKWKGTTALTYSPKYNNTTRFELRRQYLQYKISMSPLGDMARGAWRLFNADVFPLTHFRMPFMWLLARAKWVAGYPRALGRWTRTATHHLIDDRFAYQTNRFNEHRDEDIYHYANEYDYLKEYMLPTLVRGIRNYDFDILRSAVSKQALRSIVKWMKIQHKYGVFYEMRRNYHIETIDIREILKDEHGVIYLDVEFGLVEPPYFYNSSGGKIFNKNIEYKWNYKPQPLIMRTILQRDYTHPDFDYQVVLFECDARRIKRVFNEVERIYHGAQRNRSQYHNAPKFYAVPRGKMGNKSYYSPRPPLPGGFQYEMLSPWYTQKELELARDIEFGSYDNPIHYSNAAYMSRYITALELGPQIEAAIQKQQQEYSVSLHPIERDRDAYWEKRREFDLVKYRQREARRVRAIQNSMHRYLHKLRALASMKHTFDHGGNFDEYRRIHLDKLALDANADDWVQKWIVDPERRGRPVFKGTGRWWNKHLRSITRQFKFNFMNNHKGVTRLRSNRVRRTMMKRQAVNTGRRRRRTGYIFKRHRKKRQRRRRLGNGMKKQMFKKRRRFLPFMERVHTKGPRGGFNELDRFFRHRNQRINAFKGQTALGNPKAKGPGYPIVDGTEWYERWHVWDGGFYNPSRNAYTLADEFNPLNDAFSPRRRWLLSFYESSNWRMPYYDNQNPDLPWRIFGPLEYKRYSYRNSLANKPFTRWRPRPQLSSLSYIPKKESNLRYEDWPNVQDFNEKDDEYEQQQLKMAEWPIPKDLQWGYEAEKQRSLRDKSPTM